MTDAFSRYQKTGLGYTPQGRTPDPGEPTFREELTSLINRYSEENPSGTPDFVLSDYLLHCLETFNHTVAARAQWRGESVELPALQGPSGKKVPLVTYTDGRRNEVGEAYISVWPGETETYDAVQEVLTMHNAPPTGKHHPENIQTDAIPKVTKEQS